MLLKNAFASLIAISMFPVIASAVIPKRIQGFFLDKGQVHRIYSSPGRSTLIQLPCNVMSVSKGPTADFDAQINEKDSRLVEIWAQRTSPDPAGLKVLCKDEFFFFDVTFSANSHQDFVDIKGATGFIPTSSSGIENSKLIKSSELITSQTQSITKMRLLSSSEASK